MLAVLLFFSLVFSQKTFLGHQAGASSARAQAMVAGWEKGWLSPQGALGTAPLGDLCLCPMDHHYLQGRLVAAVFQLGSPLPWTKSRV